MLTSGKNRVGGDLENVQYEEAIAHPHSSARTVVVKQSHLSLNVQVRK